MRNLHLIMIVFAVSLAFTACKNRENIANETESSTTALVEEKIRVDSVILADPSLPAEPREVIFYERTACFGTCPSFIFRAMDNGQVYFQGRNFVDMIGNYKAETNPVNYVPVFMKAHAMRYDTLADRYDNQMVTDLPAVITVLNGKQVYNRYQGPDLRELYATIDSLITTIEWSPKRNDR